MRNCADVNIGMPELTTTSTPTNVQTTPSFHKPISLTQTAVILPPITTAVPQPWWLSHRRLKRDTSQMNKLSVLPSHLFFRRKLLSNRRRKRQIISRKPTNMDYVSKSLAFKSHAKPNRGKIQKDLPIDIKPELRSRLSSLFNDLIGKLNGRAEFNPNHFGYERDVDVWGSLERQRTNKRQINNYNSRNDFSAVYYSPSTSSLPNDEQEQRDLTLHTRFREHKNMISNGMSPVNIRTWENAKGYRHLYPTSEESDEEFAYEKHTKHFEDSEYPFGFNKRDEKDTYYDRTSATKYQRKNGQNQYGGYKHHSGEMNTIPDINRINRFKMSDVVGTSKREFRKFTDKNEIDRELNDVILFKTLKLQYDLANKYNFLKSNIPILSEIEEPVVQIERIVKTDGFSGAEQVYTNPTKMDSSEVRRDQSKLKLVPDKSTEQREQLNMTLMTHVAQNQESLLNNRNTAANVESDINLQITSDNRLIKGQSSKTKLGLKKEEFKISNMIPVLSETTSDSNDRAMFTSTHRQYIEPLMPTLTAHGIATSVFLSAMVNSTVTPMISKSSIKSRREKQSKGIDLTTRLHERYGEEHKAPLYPNLSKSSGTSHNGNNTEIPNKPLKPLVDNQHLDLISNESLFIQRSTSAKADNSNMQITKITEKGKSKKNKIVKLTDSELTIPRKSVITMQSNTSKRQRYVQIPVNQSNTSKQQRHVQIPVNPSISKQTTLTDPNFQRKGTIKNKSEIKGNIVQQHKTGTGFLESALYVGKEITKTAPEPLHPLTPIQDKHVTDQTYLDKTHINNLELSLEPENRLQKIRPTTDLYLGKPVHSLKETPIIGTELSNKDKSIINISNIKSLLGSSTKSSEDGNELKHGSNFKPSGLIGRLLENKALKWSESQSFPKLQISKPKVIGENQKWLDRSKFTSNDKTIFLKLQISEPKVIVENQNVPDRKKFSSNDKTISFLGTHEYSMTGRISSNPPPRNNMQFTPSKSLQDEEDEDEHVYFYDIGVSPARKIKIFTPNEPLKPFDTPSFDSTSSSVSSLIGFLSKGSSVQDTSRDTNTESKREQQYKGIPITIISDEMSTVQRKEEIIDNDDNPRLRFLPEINDSNMWRYPKRINKSFQPNRIYNTVFSRRTPGIRVYPEMGLESNPRTPLLFSNSRQNRNDDQLIRAPRFRTQLLTSAFKTFPGLSVTRVVSRGLPPLFIKRQRRITPLPKVRSLDFMNRLVRKQYYPLLLNKSRLYVHRNMIPRLFIVKRRIFL